MVFLLYTFFIAIISIVNADPLFMDYAVQEDYLPILGFHIIGPYAPILIQEVINIMALNGGVSHLGHGMHIHPALPEIVTAAFGRLQKPEKKV